MAEITREDVRAALEECLGEGFEPTYDETDLVNPVESAKDLIRYSAFVLLQNPDAKFFLSYIFGKNLKEDVDTLVDDFNEAIDAVDDFIKSYDEPNSSTLAKASSALDRAARAVDEGSYAHYSVQKASTKMREYADGVGDQLLGSGTFSLPSSYAKYIVQAFVTGLKERLDDVTDRVSTLKDMDLDTSWLEKVAAAKTLIKVAEKLSEKEEELNSSTTLEKQAAVKSLYLFLRAAQLVLSSTSTYPDPDSSRAEGSCSPNNSPAEPSRTVTLPELMGSISMPVANDDPTAAMTVNEVLYPIDLPTSPQAEVMGMEDEPFDFWFASRAAVQGTATAPYNFAVNRDWVVYIDGIAFSGTIPAGAYGSTALMCTTISTQLTNPTYGPITNYADVYDAGGFIRIAYNDGVSLTGDHRIITPNDTIYNVVNSTLGFGPPHGVDSDDVGDARSQIGRDANNVLDARLDANVITTMIMPAGSSTAAAIAAHINTVYGIPAGSAGPRLYMRSNTYGDGGRIRVIGGSAMDVLGFYADQTSQSSHIPANAFIGYIMRSLGGAEADMYSVTTEKLAGTQLSYTVPGTPDEIQLPAGSGANVAIGDTLIVLDGFNSGHYHITNINVGTDIATVERDQFEDQDGGGAPLEQHCRVLNRNIAIRSTQRDSLEATLEADGSLNAVVGWPMGKIWGTVSDVKTTDSIRYARVGDYLTEPGGTHTILAIDGGIISLTPEIEMNAGSQDFTIYSADKNVYDGVEEELETWYSTAITLFSNLSSLLAATNRAINSPSIANRNQLEAELETYRDIFSAAGNLQEILEGFICRSLIPVENLLKTLEDRKLSRGADELRELEFNEFFDYGNALSHAQNAYEKLASLLKAFFPGDIVNPDADEEVIDISGVEGSSISTDYEDVETIEETFVGD